MRRAGVGVAVVHSQPALLQPPQGFFKAQFYTKCAVLNGSLFSKKLEYRQFVVKMH